MCKTLFIGFELRLGFDAIFHFQLEPEATLG